MDKNAVKLSKFLSLVLRHQPETIGLVLDPQGWTPVADLISKAHASGMSFSHDDLLQVVAANDKQRFTLSDDGLLIRAAQGHSVPVSLGLTPQVPPTTLFHGTATRFLASILAGGLQPQSRRQVHLSADVDTARAVGQRHGQPVILLVAAGAMHQQGFAFYQADNGVWLTDQVPPAFLSELPKTDALAGSAT